MINLCLQIYHVLYVKCFYPFLHVTTTTFHTVIKGLPHFCEQSMIASKKSASFNYSYASLSMLIAFLPQVILNFQSAKMILAFNIFSFFTLIALVYTKFYTSLCRRSTNYSDQHVFLLWFFICFLPLSDF